MDEKKANDKSFEHEKQRKQKKNPAEPSQPAMSYREVRAKSESGQRKKKQSGKSAKNPGNLSQGADDKHRPQQKNGTNAPKPAQAGEKSQPKQQFHRSEHQGKPKQSPQNEQARRKKPQNLQKVQAQQVKSNNEHKPEQPAQEKRRQESAAHPKGSAAPSKGAAPTKKKPHPKQHPSAEPETWDKDEKPLKPSKPFSARKRRRKLLAMYSSMIVVILVIAIFLCLTVFFKIDSITVEGETRYSADEIIQASGVSMGTNLLLCDTDSGISVIEKEFPYIETVSIRKNPFNSVTIFVEEAKPTTAVETNGKFYILSESGKIIEILDSNKYKVPLIKGAELKKTELSATIEYKLDSMNSIINQITEALKTNEISNVSTIDVTSPSNIKLSYDKRLTVIIGMPEDIDYKIKTAKILIDEKLEKDSKGTVDVSMCAEGGKYSYYDPSGAPTD